MNPEKWTLVPVLYLSCPVQITTLQCISILHPPGADPLGYETAAERWSPVQNVEKILISVVSMLAEPNPESAANVDAAVMWRDDKKEFCNRAQNAVKLSLKNTVV